jgi:hypothetical protein
MKQRSTTGVESRLASSLAWSLARNRARLPVVFGAAALVFAVSLPAVAQHAGRAMPAAPHMTYGASSGSYHPQHSSPQHAQPAPPQHSQPAPPQHAQPAPRPTVPPQSHVVPAQPNPVNATGHPAPAQPGATQPGSNRAPVVRGNPNPEAGPHTPSYGPNAHGGTSAGPGAGIRPGHLGDWMQGHQNLSPSEQQHALEHEPGFNHLPPDQQARLRGRLQELNSMSPAERQRTINRIEKMESLTPEQRQQVTHTMTQMRSLPPDQQRGVAQAFRQVRQLPPDQRAAAAQGYGRQLNPQQRDTLNNLLRAEPYLPIQRANPAPSLAPAPAP